MQMNAEMTALQNEGRCRFEGVDIGGPKTIFILPDGRRNIMPFSQSEIRHGCRWQHVADEIAALSRFTGPDALDIAIELHRRLEEQVPGIRLVVDGRSKNHDRPVTFKATAGRLTVRGGFPWVMDQVAGEAERIVTAFEAARRIVETEIASWRRTVIDASGVAIAAGLTNLDGEAFFARIARDPAKVEGIVGDGLDPTASVPSHEVGFPDGLMFRTTGRATTATLKTKSCTFDGCKVIVKDAPQIPETLLTTVKGRPLDTLIKIPGIDGSELIVKKVDVAKPGNKTQMTIHLVPRPLRMEEARAMYDRLRERAIRTNRSSGAEALASAPDEA